MRNLLISASVAIMAFAVHAADGPEQIRAAAEKVKTSCEGDVKTAGCKVMDVGSTISKCLFDYHKKNPSFKRSEACNQAIQAQTAQTQAVCADDFKAGGCEGKEKFKAVTCLTQNKTYKPSANCVLAMQGGHDWAKEAVENKKAAEQSKKESIIKEKERAQKAKELAALDKKAKKEQAQMAAKKAMLEKQREARDKKLEAQLRKRGIVRTKEQMAASAPGAAGTVPASTEPASK